MKAKVLANEIFNLPVVKLCMCFSACQLVIIITLPQIQSITGYPLENIETNNIHESLQK